MEEILKTEIIEKGKSRYFLDLMKSPNGKLFITISQHIISNGLIVEKSSIMIRTTDLAAIIDKLKNYQLEIKSTYPRKKALTKMMEQELLGRSLGQNLEILAVQFDSSVREIKELFYRNNVWTTNNKIRKASPPIKFLKIKRRRSG